MYLGIIKFLQGSKFFNYALNTIFLLILHFYEKYTPLNEVKNLVNN